MMRNWLIIVLLLTLGGLAFACSSGDDDASATSTPRDSGDAAVGTPTDGSASDGTAATVEPGDPGAPGEPGAPGNEGDNESGAPGNPQAPDGGPVGITDGVMRLTILDGGSCDGEDCFVDAGSTFTLAVEVVQAPASNYFLVQTFVDFGAYNPGASEDGAGSGSCDDGIDNGELDGADRLDDDCVSVNLIYVPADAAVDEVVWVDLNPGTAVRGNIGAGTVLHGGLTGLIPPLPTSSATGVVVQFQMTCSASPGQVPVSLLVSNDPLAGTSGSLFVGSDDATQFIPSVSPITVHCE